MKFILQIVFITGMLLFYTMIIYDVGYKAGVRSMDVIIKKEVCKQ